MSRAVLLALLAVGCGRQLNPEYCAHNPDDTDCRTKGLAMVDAPAGCQVVGCTDQKQPVCEVSSGSCVECLPQDVMGSDPAQCPVDQICGQDRKCHACIVDTDCKDSKVCLSDGTCAMTSNVLYAAPAPAGTGTACTIDVPCTFNTAVSQMSGTRNIVKMTTTKGTDYSEPAVVLGNPGTIIGTGATFIPSGPQVVPAISMSELANVEILGLTIQSSKAQGILCTKTPLQLRRAAIFGSATLGLQGTECAATVERTKFVGNVGGALFLTGPNVFEIRNNVFGPDNGDGGTDKGNVHLDKAMGRVIFNTVVKNNGKNNKPAGINATGSATLLVAHNIVAKNGDNRAGSQISGDALELYNTVVANIADIHFASEGANDFHLTKDSPTANPLVRDDADADGPPRFACRLPGGNDMSPHIDDFDGYARPFAGYCDRGAYEYHTP